MKRGSPEHVQGLGLLLFEYHQPKPEDVPVYALIDAAFETAVTLLGCAVEDRDFGKTNRAIQGFWQVLSEVLLHSPAHSFNEAALVALSEARSFYNLAILDAKEGRSIGRHQAMAFSALERAKVFTKTSRAMWSVRSQE